MNMREKNMVFFSFAVIRLSNQLFNNINFLTRPQQVLSAGKRRQQEERGFFAKTE
jgi:hypothetical protein